MARFVVLMREDDHAWSKLTPQAQASLLKRYVAWVEELKRSGTFLGGEPIGEGGRVLSAAEGRISDQPFEETKMVITGFFLIEASDLDEAARVARGCPALIHGETVEVRPVGHA